MQKYIQIRHWNYWWEVYGCGAVFPAGPHAVEFSLTDDEEGGTVFFHFDFYNLSGLRDTLWEGNLFPAEHPDHALFLQRAEELALGKADFFVGSLYYPDFLPDLTFCSQPLAEGRRLPDLKAPAAAPYYAAVFLAEDRPLMPELLETWTARLSQSLFGWSFAARIASAPSRQEALASWKADGPPRV
jgi:hypothetical protein